MGVQEPCRNPPVGTSIAAARSRRRAICV